MALQQTSHQQLHLCCCQQACRGNIRGVLHSCWCSAGRPRQSHRPPPISFWKVVGAFHRDWLWSARATRALKQKCRPVWLPLASLSHFTGPAAQCLQMRTMVAALLPCSGRPLAWFFGAGVAGITVVQARAVCSHRDTWGAPGGCRARTRLKFGSTESHRSAGEPCGVE